MRIKLKTNYCGPIANASKNAEIQSFAYEAGCVIDLPDKVAKELIEGKFATDARNLPLGMPKRAETAQITDPGEMATLAAMNG